MVVSLNGLSLIYRQVGPYMAIPRCISMSGFCSQSFFLTRHAGALKSMSKSKKAKKATVAFLRITNSLPKSQSWPLLIEMPVNHSTCTRNLICTCLVRLQEAGSHTCFDHGRVHKNDCEKYPQHQLVDLRAILCQSLLLAEREGRGLPVRRPSDCLAAIGQDLIKPNDWQILNVGKSLEYETRLGCV